MKKILSLGFSIIFCVTCNAQTNYSKKQLLKFFNDNLQSYTNSIPLTKNLNFYLTSHTHGLYPATKFNSDEIISIGLIQTPINISNTNVIVFDRIPYNQTFDFHLFDENGKEMIKTEKGLSLSQPVSPARYEWDKRGLVSEFIKNNEDLRNLFRPEDVFVISNKGIYDLSICMRICVPMVNNAIDTNALTSFHASRNATNFGVISSPPLKAIVIKN